MERSKACVYKNLAIQMLLQNISRRKIAELTHINYKAICRKLNGETAISVDEAISIHEVLGKVMPIEELFSKG